MNGLKHFAHVTLCLPLDFIALRNGAGENLINRK